MTENARKNLIPLRLGPSAETWSQQQAYEQTLARLRNLDNLLDPKNVYFLRDAIVEILEQSPPGAFDFRLIPEFFEQKQRQKGQQLWAEYLSRAGDKWREMIQVEPFKVDFGEFTLEPAILNEEYKELMTYAHLTRPEKIDQITSIPKSDLKTQEQWKSDLFNADSQTDKFFDPKTDLHVLSLKEISWRFGFFDKNRLDALKGEPLKETLMNHVKGQVLEHGGIKTTIIYPQLGAEVRAILSKPVTPAYKITLMPEFRRQLLKEAEAETEPEKPEKKVSILQSLFHSANKGD